ncbi:sugar-binding protein [Pseudomonas sp. 21LCFQ010]|uniref:RHS repeat domain-containing protein n=1 Tax=Pseudomonas sp. 21LCFQ010 TaxID=2957506 RepID=UPI0020973067|nr:RHS repeat-associated core domain-containing protein [Pseudomonas sp. 21LCFQ010]MCO8160806.1 sugar-binding protein [Pseudomonas sp. 21LCFQ010]
MATALHSNALNFMSFIEGGVDPRTGLYTFSVNLPELHSDDLAGPAVPLALGFSPLNNEDTGLGLGWSLQLSRYHRDTRILSLSTGEAFKVTEVDGRGQMLMKEKKLDSFHAAELVGNQYRIAHKSGLVETLQEMGSDERPVALPVKIQSADGRQVTLSYEYFNGQPLLAEVRDRQRRLLTLQRTSNQVLLSLDPDHSAALFSFTLGGADNRVERISLPTVEQAGWRLQYQALGGLLHVSEVWTPSGAHERLRYDDAGHAFPGATGRPNLRRVTGHSTDPGRGQPPIEVGYSYGNRDVPAMQNFLGFNASGLVWEDNGLDNLYRITGSYLYGSSEILLEGGQPVRTIERTFNRFHLLTEQLTTQGRKVRRSATRYHASDDLDFDQQPAFFQLPDTVTDSWYDLDDPNRVRSETVKTRYDGFGNLLEEIKASGLIETRTWYPATGEPGQCPADPEGFVRQLASSTVTPASSSHGEAAPVLRHRYRYQALASVADAGQPWLVMSEDQLLQVEQSHETLLQRIESSYLDAPADRFGHGRLLQERLTLNGVTHLTDYRYSTNPERHVLHTEQTLSSSLDAERKLISLEHSLLSGLLLLTHEADNDVQIRYQYDALQRVTLETVAPDDPQYQASRQYRYGLVGAGGQTAWQEVTDVKGLTRRSELDGLSRVIEEQRQDVDGDNALRRTYTAQYDARGRLASETEYDWLASRNLALTRRQGYDDWGQAVSETGPDGVLSFSLNEPFGWLDPQGAYRPAQLSWQQPDAATNQRFGLTISQLNAFGKPDSIERFDLDGHSLGQQLSFYDGLGRCVQSVDLQGYTTSYRYDAFDRLLCTTLPNGDQVLRQFTAHSSAELPSQLQVQPANAGLPTITVGEQDYDSLERVVRLKTGTRTEQYRYAPGQAQASERISAAGASIHYRYAPGLTAEPLSTEAPDEQVSFDYDRLSAQLLSASNSQGSRHYRYDSTGQLREATWHTAQGSWTSEYQHSLLGRALHSRGIDGLHTDRHYDAQGRLQSLTQGNIQAAFEYDALGRPSRIVTNSPDNSLDTRLEYDEHSREVLRTLYPTGQSALSLSQAWRNDDQLLERHLQQGGNSLLRETFNYDNRGRLIDYRCDGSQLPADEQGNRIKQQLFRFDALDNLTLSISRFADAPPESSSDHATYSYAADDPCRLQQITHTHPSYPAYIDFAYDADGNQLNDQHGRRLHYDSQGRLLDLHGPAGEPLGQYRYDGHNSLLSITGDNAEPRWHFFDEQGLGSTVQAQTHTHYLSEGGTPLAQQSNDSAPTLLLACNAANSVVAELQDQQYRHARYNAWGQRSSGQDEPLLSTAGFNGEPQDALTGCYLLGQGYRAYNPALMRFHSPDSLSPFGAGGLNPYAYCLGNPVAFQDPSGHSVGQLEYSRFKPNVGGIALNLLISAVFTGLAIGTLGSATPFIMAISIAGAGAGVIGTGYTTAAMLQRDPKKAQQQSEIGAAAHRLEMLFGLAFMAKGMGKWLVKKTAALPLKRDWQGNAEELWQTKYKFMGSSADQQPLIQDMQVYNRFRPSKATQTEDFLINPRPQTSPLSSPAVSRQPSISSSGSSAVSEASLPVQAAPKIVGKPIPPSAQWPTVQSASGLKHATGLPTAGNPTYQFTVPEIRKPN